MAKRRSDLTHIGDLLADILPPDLIIPADSPNLKPIKPASKRIMRRVHAVERIIADRSEDKQSIGYLAKPFLLLGLPFKPPPKNTTYYRRENGTEYFEITGSPVHGLPFGEDILVLIWVSTLAILNMDKSTGKVPRVIEFRRAADMLKAFGLPLDGRTYRRMQERFLRVFYATFFYGQKKAKGRAAPYSVRFFDHIDLWFTRDLESDTLPGEEFKNNRIVMSEAFAHDLELHHPPIELEAVKAWADKPAQLFFYLWLVYRCYVARGRAEIPLMGQGSVKEQCGMQGYDEAQRGPRNLRMKVKKWLAGVKLAWPECPVSLVTDDHKRGDYLIIEGQATAIHSRKFFDQLKHVHLVVAHVEKPFEINSYPRASGSAPKASFSAELLLMVRASGSALLRASGSALYIPVFLSTFIKKTYMAQPSTVDNFSRQKENGRHQVLRPGANFS